MLYFHNSMFTYCIYLYVYVYIHTHLHTYIYYMNSYFFYVSGSVVVPSVHHLNMNKTINYKMC